MKRVSLFVPVMLSLVDHGFSRTYLRTDLFERRHRLMEDWAEYLEGRREGTEI